MSLERPIHYILDSDRRAIALPNTNVALLMWGRWLEETKDRVVAQDWVGPYMVSTVFLGLDHNYSLMGPPLLFETMVFCDGGSLDEQERCSTWEQAELMHAEMVQKVRSLPMAKTIN